MFYSFFSIDFLVSCGQYLDEKKNLVYHYIDPDWSTNSYDLSTSLDYALFLLYTDKEKNLSRIKKIISAVLKHQNTQQDSPHFGTWPPLVHKDSRKNPGKHSIGTNGRIGVALLQILDGYSDILPDNLVEQLRKACTNTAFSFISIYNNQSVIEIVQMSYTTTICGERYGFPEFVKYGEQIFMALYNRIIYHNSFFEYNNVAHDFKCIRLLQLFLKDAQNTLCLKFAEQLHDMLWRVFAEHFHRPTMQLAGPFALSDYDYLSSEFYNFLYGACNGKVYFPHTSANPDELAKCPIKYYPYFTGEKKIDFMQRLVSYGMAFPFFRFSMVASTYMHSKYSFGTFNRETFWQYRRPFIGYFGGSKKTYLFKLEVLRDFFPYASAALHSLQNHGDAIGHITFLTDRGNRHIVNDGPNDILTCRDFRVRFSVLGKTEDLKIARTKKSLELTYEDIRIYYTVSFIKFDGFEPKFKIYEDENGLFFDVILHNGEETTIDFTAMESAILEFVFLITSSGRTPAVPETVFENNLLTSQIQSENLMLRLSTPATPARQLECFSYDRQTINDVVLEDYVTQINMKTDNFAFIDKINQPQTARLPISVDTSETSELSVLLEDISSKKLNELDTLFSRIITQLSDNGYSLLLQKEITIRIVISIFECAKNTDYKFDEFITRKYSNIFYKISSAVSFDAIKKDLSNLYESILADADFLNNKLKNKTVISSMMQIIDDNLLSTDLSLKFISNKLGYSTSHLSRLFVKEVQTNYVTYVQKQKIAYAITQLKSGNTSIQDISKELGYSTPSSFMRMFHKITGLTVLQYIKSDI